MREDRAQLRCQEWISRQLRETRGWRRGCKALTCAALTGALVSGCMGMAPLTAAATGSMPKHHPPSPKQMAQDMAEAWGISPDTLLGCFVEGGNFRDIEMSALLAQVSGHSFAEIYAQHQSSRQNWAGIASSLGVPPEKIHAARQHLLALLLSRQTGLDAQTNEALLTEGYRPPDIAAAAALSKSTGKAVSDILALKKINNTWKSVASSLGIDETAFRSLMEPLAFGPPPGPPPGPFPGHRPLPPGALDNWPDPPELPAFPGPCR